MTASTNCSAPLRRKFRHGRRSPEEEGLREVARETGEAMWPVHSVQRKFGKSIRHAPCKAAAARQLQPNFALKALETKGIHWI